MNYLHEVLKTAHILAVVVWIGGMLAVVLILPHIPGGQTIGVLRARLGPAISVAMIFALSLGLAMAAEADWFGQRWITLKLGLAIVLAGIHGIVTGQMRRLSAAAEPWPMPWSSYLPITIGVLALLTIGVAVVKL
jgi:uncharacterized membrane protein